MGLFTPEEIKIAQEQGLSAEAICLMENGFVPSASCAEEIAASGWIIGNAFRQGYIDESNTAAHSLLDKLEA